LRRGLTSARAGRGRLFLLAGEAGIGRTRTATELAGQARRRGMLVLWGRCREGVAAPPFWPWVQVLRHSAAASNRVLPAALGADPTVAAQAVAVLGCEVRARRRSRARHQL